MRSARTLLALALVLASCASPDPVLQPSPTSADTQDQDGAGTDTHDEPSGDHAHGDMQSLEWDGGTLPELSISVTGDSAQGWTVATSITNFTLTGSDASDHVPGQGHAHIWVDGRVFTMISEPTVVIPILDPGTHEIMVTLSSNDHMDYVHDGEPLMARTIVEVAGVEEDHPVFTVEIAGGTVTIDADRPRVNLGDEVELRITSDVTDEVHVHGYDVTGALQPGVEAIMRFVADVPGIFEVELESSGVHLFDLQVG
jgi:hypothetical protein